MAGLDMVAQGLNNLKSTFGLGAGGGGGSSMTSYMLASKIQQLPAEHQRKVQQEEQEDRLKCSPAPGAQRGGSYQMSM